MDIKYEVSRVVSQATTTEPTKYKITATGYGTESECLEYLSRISLMLTKKKNQCPKYKCCANADKYIACSMERDKGCWDFEKLPAGSITVKEGWIKSSKP